MSNEQRAKIYETFKSIQGEGKYAGVAQVFVRFFECNMHCGWCDTPHSIGDGKREYTENSVGELFSLIEKDLPGCHSVSLTGGEPLLQAPFIAEFIPTFRQSGIASYLETNGIFPKELESLIDLIDIISMDFKLPTSTGCREYWQEHEEFLKIAKRKDLFIKAVITGSTDEKDIQRSVELIEKVSPSTTFFLQPNHAQVHNGALIKCLDFQKYCSKYLKDVRVLPQVHKFIKQR